jgi:hypothetical protein
MGSYSFPGGHAGFEDGRASCEHADIIPVNSGHQKREASRKNCNHRPNCRLLPIAEALPREGGSPIAWATGLQS